MAFHIKNVRDRSRLSDDSALHAKINVVFSQQLLVQKRPVLYQNGAKIDMFLGYFNMSSENGSKGLKTGGLGRSVGAPSDRDSPTVRGRVGRSADSSAPPCRSLPRSSAPVP